jgi:predicted TIM-barrel fold metal-dependent hydrolase
MGAARRLIDGDGHVLEDYPEIVRRLPAEYRDDFEAGKLNPLMFLFPSLDHFHSLPTRMRGLADRAQGPVGPPEWLEFLDDVGIEHTVLYPSLALSIGLIRDRHWSVVVARAYNEWLSETYVRDGSGRFSGLGILPMQVPEAAAQELRRAVEQLGLRGGMIPSHGLPLHLGSREYWPVYEQAEALGCPIAFHGGSHEGFGFDDLNVFAAAHALGHPFGLLITMAGMVFNGVYDRFPTLRTAYLEGGSGWVLLALERFAESYKGFTPYAADGELVQLGNRSVEEYIVELMRQGRIVIGCEGGEQHLEYAVESLGFAPFMYSSDFPHEVDAASCKHEIEELEETKMSEEAKAAILGGTAQQFYGM